MNKVGVIIDRRKLAVFERRLTEAGYSYEIIPQMDPYLAGLKVMTERIAPLQKVIEAAQKECAG